MLRVRFLPLIGLLGLLVLAFGVHAAGASIGIAGWADGAPDAPAWQLAASPSYDIDGTLFAAAQDGIWKSTDRGATWTLVLSLPGARHVVISPDFSSDGIVYGADDSHLYRSDDGGSHWTDLGTPPALDVLGLSPAFAADHTLIVAGDGGQVYRSGDAGATWTASNAGIDPGFFPFDIAFSPNFASDHTVFLAGFGPLYRSTDGGLTWTSLPGSHGPNYGVAVSPSYATDHTVIVSYREIEPSGVVPESGLFRSTDGGDTWTYAGWGTGGAYEPFPGPIAFSPNYAADRTVYVADMGTPFMGPRRVYRSVDGGETWSALPDPPSDAAAHDLLVTTGSLVVHLANDAGIWHYDDTTRNYLRNGDFEGDFGWIFGGARPPVYTSEQRHGGTRSVRTGLVTGTATYSYSEAWQEVEIPADATQVTLRFWRYAVSQEVPAGQAVQVPLEKLPHRLEDGRIPFGTAASDLQYALIIRPNGSLHWLLREKSNRQTWEEATYDLTSYRGQRVTIVFGTYNDSLDGITAMYVDDAALEVSFEELPTATPTFTPTATHTPTSTPTATPTPSPTATPSGLCQQLLINGSFETDEAWERGGLVLPSYVTDPVLDGLRSARTGLASGSPRYSYSEIWQRVTVPADADTVTLRFWRFTQSGEVTAGAKEIIPLAELPDRLIDGVIPFSPQASDLQYALVIRPNGTLHWLLRERANAQRWEMASFDLTAYRGQTITIDFGTYNDSLDGITAMYVDAVSLEACPPLHHSYLPHVVNRYPLPPEDALLVDGEWADRVIGHRLSPALYAYVGGALYRRTDAGGAWALMNASPPVASFKMAPSAPDVLYGGPGIACLAGGPDQPMYKSVDGGASWMELPTGLNLEPLLTHPSDPDRAFARGCDAPYLTTDGGMTWLARPDTGPETLWSIFEVRTMVDAPLVDGGGTPTWDRVYAGGASEGGGGVLAFTPDQGATWQRLSPLSGDIWWVTAVEADPYQAGRIWFAEPHGVWQTLDHGATWTLTDAGLEDVVYQDVPGATFGLYALRYHVGTDRLYLGTVRGLYWRQVTETTWHKVTGTPFDETEIDGLVLSQADPDLLYVNAADGVHVYTITP